GVVDTGSVSFRGEPGPPSRGSGPQGGSEVAFRPNQATTLALVPYAVVHQVRYAACSMRLLLVTPPMSQLNTPYPATAYLMGFLRLHAADLGLELTQADASLTLFLRLFSAPLVARAANVLRQRARSAGKCAPVPPSIAHFLKHAKRYADTVGPAIRFLQRRDPSFAVRIAWRARRARLHRRQRRLAAAAGSTRGSVRCATRAYSTTAAT